MNILFTCAGRRNYLINYFKKAVAAKGKIFAADMQQNAPAMVDADHSIVSPSIYDPNYIDFLLRVCSEHHIKAIVSLNDLELPILSINKSKFNEAGVFVIVANPEQIDIAFDKWKTVKFLNQIKLKTPKTYIDLAKAKADLLSGELNFPVVVKPRWGSASIAVDFADNMEELDLIYRIQLIKLKKSILLNASQSDLAHSILIQEKISGVEFGMDVLNDFKGNYFDCFAREKLSMRSGETDKAKSVIDESLTAVGRKIGEELGHIGNLDCDVFFDGKDYFVLELNPRFGGGYPFSHEAGIDTASVYISWLNGVADVSQHANYKHGITFSKCDRLINVT